MGQLISDAFDRLGLPLGAGQQAIANYVLAARHNDLLLLSGHLPVGGERAWKGRLGEMFSVEDGRACAQLAAINALRTVQHTLDDGEEVARVLQLRGFVACSGEFVEHSAVLDGASDIIIEVLGERGRHARTTVGVPSLPMGHPVELDLVVSIESL